MASPVFKTVLLFDQEQLDAEVALALVDDITKLFTPEQAESCLALTKESNLAVSWSARAPNKQAARHQAESLLKALDYQGCLDRWNWPAISVSEKKDA